MAVCAALRRQERDGRFVGRSPETGAVTRRVGCGSRGAEPGLGLQARERRRTSAQEVPRIQVGLTGQ